MKKEVVVFKEDENAREKKVKIVNGVKHELKVIRASSRGSYIDWVPEGKK